MSESVDKELLTFMYRLKYLNRYEAWPRITQETVAEHSYFVTLFSMMLCDELNIDAESRMICLEMAITHDIPEILLSDIPHPAKEYLKENGIKIDGMEQNTMMKILPPYAKHVGDFEEVNSLEATIVKIADIIQCIQYCLHEESLGSNVMKEMRDDIFKRYLIYKERLFSQYGYETTLFDY